MRITKKKNWGGEKLILSIITTWSTWEGTEEMLIPKVIGKIIKGFSSLRRLNRMLAVGHRYHGYVC
jgi:hypothetical protein